MESWVETSSLLSLSRSLNNATQWGAHSSNVEIELLVRCVTDIPKPSCDVQAVSNLCQRTPGNIQEVQSFFGMSPRITFNNIRRNRVCRAAQLTAKCVAFCDGK